MAEVSGIEIHPFMADRFAEAVVPALMILVVDHDARPLERFIDRVAKTDAKWLDVARARVDVARAAEAVEPLPTGTPPEDIIAVHDVGKDAHTGRDVVLKPPAWAQALNAVALDLCVCTGRVPGWNPKLLAKTDDGETLDQFVAAARTIHPEALAWYSKLTAGLLAWTQGGSLLGFLTRAEVPAFRQLLTADERQMFMWKQKGGDFHRRKVQAFCFLAEKNAVGLAAIRKP